MIRRLPCRLSRLQLRSYGNCRNRLPNSGGRNSGARHHASDGASAADRADGPVLARTVTNTAVPRITCPADCYAGLQLQSAVNLFIRMTEKRPAANAAASDMPELAGRVRARPRDQNEDSEA